MELSRHIPRLEGDLKPNSLSVCRIFSNCVEYIREKGELNFKEIKPMKNCDIELKKNILTITIDLTKEFGLSASGKNIIIGSTQGNVSIQDIKVGLNVYKHKQKTDTPVEIKEVAPIKIEAPAPKKSAKSKKIKQTESIDLKESSKLEGMIKQLCEMGTVSISKTENLKGLQLELLKLGYVTVSSFKTDENCLKCVREKLEKA